MTDDELLQAIREAAKRQNEVQVRPLDAETRARIAQRFVVASAPRRRRRLQARAAAVVAGLALAAGVAMIVRPGGSAPLPPYELAASGGAQERRGEPTAPSERTLRLRAGDHFDVVLRPPTEVRGAVGARAFLVEGGEVRPFTGAIEISPRGAVRIAGTRGDFAGVVPGSGEIVIAVGRPEALAQHAGPAMASTSDYQVHRTPVTIE